MSLSNKHIAIIDVSKAAAAFCVCLYHFIYHNDHSGNLIENRSAYLVGFTNILWSTVFIFFVISAFAISAHLNAANYTIKDLPKFLGKRMIRIYFPYLICIVAYLLLEVFFNIYNKQAIKLNWQQFFANLTFTADFTNQKWYNPVFWTLAIEIQFYVLMAIIFPIFQWLTARKLFVVILAFHLLIPFVISDNKLIFIYMPMLCIGYALFANKENSISLMLTILSVLTCAIVSAYIFESIVVGIILSLFATLFLFVKMRDPYPKFSEMTYSFYLFHGISGGTFLYFTARFVDNYWLVAILIVIAIIVSILFSRLVFKWIEKPSVAWSKKWIKYDKTL